MSGKHRKSTALLLAVLFSLSILLLSGCGGTKPAAPKADAPLKVGVIGPFQTEHGVAIKESAMLAAEEINAAGGINGRKIELVYGDDENSAEKGLAALKKLYTQDKVDILMGGVASGVVNGMMDVMAQNKKIWLGTGAATPVIIERIAKDYEKYKYYFRVGTLDSTNQGKSIAEFIVDVFNKKHGMTKAAILSTNLKYSQDISEAVAKQIEAAGIKVVYREYFNSDTTDFSPNFTNAQKAGAQKNDEEYTKLIKQNLQDPRITTELVDHLPASSTVPSPLKHFGHIIGRGDHEFEERARIPRPIG